MEDNDAQLQLKKRARRRLVGAVFFVSVVALVLPMLMDHDPRPPLQDVEIRIPGQDEKPFNPAMVAVPVESAPVRNEAPVVVPTEAPARATEAAPLEAKPVDVAPAARVVETVRVQPAPAANPEVKKVPEAAPAKPAEKPVEKPAKPVAEKKPEPAKTANDEEARRAAAILAGKSPAPAAAPASSAPHLVLIGAFANEANVVNLRKKLGELGIKTYTEPLDSPQGRKIRVRAGPFPSREAAEKALAKMQKIGVSGVVAAKP